MIPRARILLVDDHEVVRLGLRALISRNRQMEVVGEAATAAEAVMQAETLQPDVVILDIRLGGSNGIDACREITTSLPGVKVIMLTSYAEDEMLFAAIRAGAAGYVLKQAGGREVVRAIELVAQGQALLDPAVTTNVIAAVRRAARAEDQGAFAGLSTQERRVLAQISGGGTNRDIAAQLHLSEGTIRNYVSNIFVKLGVSNRAEAAAFAARHHLNDFPEYSEAHTAA